jgi:hypothetical protein
MHCARAVADLREVLVLALFLLLLPAYLDLGYDAPE